MKTREKCRWLLALLVLTVTACGEEPTGPEAGDLDLVGALAKPGGKPGGGGKPAGDIALDVVFADETDRIRSDGNLTYVHKQDFVSAIIRTNGMLYFQAFAGKRKDPVLRGVTVDLGSPKGAVLSPDDLLDFEADVGPEWPVFTSDVTLHTRDANGGLHTMAVGSSIVDGGKIGFNDYGDGSWEWRLLFDSRVDGVADRIGLCATHPDLDTWLVTADGEACAGEVDGVTELWRVQGSVFTHVADFNTPMHLTLTRR